MSTGEEILDNVRRDQSSLRRWVGPGLVWGVAMLVWVSLLAWGLDRAWPDTRPTEPVEVVVPTVIAAVFFTLALRRANLRRLDRITALRPGRVVGTGRRRVDIDLDDGRLTAAVALPRGHDLTDGDRVWVPDPLPADRRVVVLTERDVPGARHALWPQGRSTLLPRSPDGP